MRFGHLLTKPEPNILRQQPKRLSSPSFRLWVSKHPMTRAHVKLLGPCFKTDRMEQGTDTALDDISGRIHLREMSRAQRRAAIQIHQSRLSFTPDHRRGWTEKNREGYFHNPNFLPGHKTKQQPVAVAEGESHGLTMRMFTAANATTPKGSTSSTTPTPQSCPECP